MPSSRRPEPWAEAPTVGQQPARGGTQPQRDRLLGQRLGGRFVLHRRLGEGGCGTVYEAHDESRDGSAVALKILHQTGVESVYRLKKEFRGLRDVVHENLVSLFELVADGDKWFFTMELVDGVPFREHVLRGGTEVDYARLGSALVQLVHGVRALHAAGLVHRDLKPSNVLVRPDGRLVIVDFGLVRLAERRDGDSLTEGSFVGTPAYAAPEQSRDPNFVTPAADWFAVGVMLYEALCGIRPRRNMGGASDSPFGRLPHVRDLAPGVPAPLAQVCMALLEAEPTARAGGEQLLATLSGMTLPARAPAVVADVDLVGREGELDTLRVALERVETGTQVALCVQGVSGIGKSTLLDAFLAKLSSRADALVLRGRCQIHENVPYKAFDALMDDLAGHLNRLPKVTAAALLPRDAALLGQVFPAIKRVSVMDSIPARPLTRRAPRDERKRAMTAFKQLLAALADHRLLVLCIDDLQWADVDSIRLLRFLLSAPDAPELLLLGALRSEDLESSAALRELWVDAGLDTPVERIELGVLDDQPTRALVSQFALGTDRVVRSIASQSGGHPYYAVELARDAASRRHDGFQAEDISLDAVIGRRVGSLSEPARGLLQVACVAGASIPVRMLQAVGGVESPATFNELRAARMLREQERGDDLLLAPYHDRIREVVDGQLSASERASLHLRIAELGEQTGSLTVEQLVMHHRAAGSLEQAHRLACEAAERAADAHAYFRAAEMLRIALEDCPAGKGRALRARLAQLLAISGQRLEAGDVYDQMADLAEDEEERFQYRVKAMEQWILVGHPRGRTLLRTLGEAQGLAPRRLNAVGTVVDMVRGMLSLWRTFDWDARVDSELTVQEQRQVTLCWSAMTASVVGGSDDLRQSMAYALVLVSRFGSKLDRDLRLVAGLIVSMTWPGWWGSIGPRTSGRLDELRCRMESREGTDLPLISRAMDAGFRLNMGRYTEGVERLEPLLHVTATSELGTVWLSAVQMGLSVGYFWLGRWEEQSKRTSEWMQSARERGDTRVEQHLMLTGTLCHLMRDAPERARRDYEHMVKASEGAHPLLADPWWGAFIALYRNEPQDALGVFRAARRLLPMGGLGDRCANFVLFRAWEAACHAQCLLRNRGGNLWRIRLNLWLCYLRPKLVARRARLHIRAILASLRQRRSAPKLLRAAADAYAEADRPMVAAALRVRLASYLTGKEAERLRAEGLAAFRERGAHRPEQWVEVLGAGIREGPRRTDP